MQYSANNKLKLVEGTDNVKRQDFVDNFNIIDDGLSKFYVATLDSANVYKVTTGNSMTSLSNGYSIRVAIPSASTGDVSVIVDSVTVPVKKPNGNAVTNFKANGVYTLSYYSSVFILASGGVDDVNFSAGDLLTGKNANNSDGEKVNGTMANNGAVTSTLSCGGSYTIPAGYHNGSGKITANSLASQTSGNAGADSLLSGHTAWVFGSKLTGTIPRLSENSNITFTNDNATKVIVGDQAFGPINNSDGNNRVLIRYSGTNGYITGNTLVGISTSNMASTLGITANKIVAGNNICGINGTATIQSMGGFPASILLDGSTGSNSNYVLSNNPSELLGRLILFITYSTSGSLLTRGWIYYDSVNTGQRTFRNFTTGGTINYYINTTSSQVTFTPSGDGWSTRRHTIMTVAVDGF